MKFLPENRKKRIWTVGLLTVLVVGILYFTFFLSVPEPRPAPTGSLGGSSGLLPFGSSFDTTVLEDEKFLKLQAPPVLTVSPEELGKSDLFSQ